MNDLQHGFRDAVGFTATVEHVDAFLAAGELLRHAFELGVEEALGHIEQEDAAGGEGVAAGMKVSRTREGDAARGDLHA